MSCSSFCPVPRKVHINASSAQLPAQITKREEFVRPDQHLHGLRAAAHRLHHIQLIGKSAPGRDSGQMLSLVYDHCCGAAIPHGVLERLLKLVCGEIPRTPCIASVHRTKRAVPGSHLSLQSMSGSPDCQQHSVKMVTPVKVSGFGSNRFDREHGNATGIGLQIRSHCLD